MPRPCGESPLVKSRKDKEAVEHSGPGEGEDEDFEFYPERDGVPEGFQQQRDTFARNCSGCCGEQAL